VSFDPIHKEDYAIYLVEQDGEEVLVDAHEYLMPMHEVFRMSMADIQTNGCAIKMFQSKQFFDNRFH
jgi:hypothetical protein